MDDNARVMTVGEWLVTMLIAAIPIVNLIMLLVWAFSGSAGTNPNKSNWAKATLIWMAIWILFTILWVVAVGGFAWMNM